MWARCMEGVRKASAHCSSTVGSHSWWCTEAAHFSPPSGQATLRAASEPALTHGTRPKVGCRFGLRSTEETRGVQHRVPVGGPVRQDSHCGDVVHTVRRNVALPVAIEPVEGESTPQRVVRPPSGLIAGPPGMEARSCNQSLSAVGESWHWSR